MKTATTTGQQIGELLAGVLQFTNGLSQRDPALRVLIVVRNMRTADQYEIANVASPEELAELSKACDDAIRLKPRTIEGLGVVSPLGTSLSIFETPPPSRDPRCMCISGKHGHGHDMRCPAFKGDA